MIYIGHFSFRQREERSKAECCHGYFHGCCRSEFSGEGFRQIRTVAAAIAQDFHRVRRLGTYLLDSCTEIGVVPKNGFLAYFVEIRGDSFGELSTELVGVSGNTVYAYHLPEDHAEEGQTPHQ